MKTKHWHEHLRSVVKKSFSPEARIAEIKGETNLVLAISWKLGTEPKRPAERSKTVRLLIEEEALEDYSEAPPGQKGMADARLKAHLTEQLMRFDPDHLAPLGPKSRRWCAGRSAP